MSQQITKAKNAIGHEVEKFANEAMASSMPIIRPLWMMNDEDPTTFHINDQFLIGDMVMVAPILHKGQVERDVYLPHMLTEDGKKEDVFWKCMNTGRIYGSGHWLKDQKAEIETILYYVRKTENPFPSRNSYN